MGNPVTLPVGGLPFIGTMSYGGISFEELFKSKVSGQVEWDRARRRVKYVRYVLEIDGYVISTNSLPNDATWSQLRYFLNKPGLALRYSDRGFASFNINADPNGLVDVCNGPKPEVVEFTPMGARLAAHIVWRCEVCIPEVSTLGAGFQSPFSRGILAFNWATELGFKADGYATYSVEGELEIARVNGVAGNLESYRAYTEPQLPAKFKPTDRSFKTDDAKRQINFRYSYEEMAPMGTPIRTTGASGSYRVNNETRGPSLVRWSASLQATYTPVATGPRREAWMRFLGIMRDRMNVVRLASVAPGDAVGGSAAVNAFINSGLGLGLPPLSGPLSALISDTGIATTLPLTTVGAGASNPLIQSFSVTEGLYDDSKSTSFECSYTFLTSFASIFRASGVWRKMGDCAGQLGADHRDHWVADMAAIVGYTSWYNYGFRPNAEVVISTDSPVIPITPAQKALQTGATDNDNNRLTAGAGLVRTGVDPDSGAKYDSRVALPGLPSPEASWLNYYVELVTDLDPGMALHKPLPQTADVVDTLGSVDLYGGNPYADKVNGINTASRSTGRDVVQRMATSTYRVGVKGYGVRAGYKVPVPDLKVFGGVAVSPAQQRVTGPRIIANYSGIPVYLTAWMLWYDVPLPPRRQQDAPPNMSEHIGDAANPPATIGPPASVPEPPIGRSDLPAADGGGAGGNDLFPIGGNNQ